jgi:hypothetical protein
MRRSANSEGVICKIRVQGILTRQTASAMGLFSDTQAGADAPPITTLTGTLHDEAELADVLDRLYALGLPLISVEREEPDQSAPADAASSREGDEPNQLT